MRCRWWPAISPPPRRQGADRCRRRFDQSRHRPRLDLHHAHCRRRRRAAADRDHGCGRSGAKDQHAGDRRRRHQIFRRSRQGARRRRRLRHDRLVARRHRRDARRGVSLSGPLLQILPRHGLGHRDGAGSADRYFQQEIKDTLKLVPEGIEGQVAYKGPVSGVLHQLVGGLARRHGLCRRGTISPTFTTRPNSCVSPRPGLRESHVHDVTITRESPNYPSRT